MIMSSPSRQHCHAFPPTFGRQASLCSSVVMGDHGEGTVPKIQAQLFTKEIQTNPAAI